MKADPARGPGLSLVGYRGTGKSTVGRLVAARLGMPFIDADSALEARFGRSIRSIFEESGEPRFRDWEEHVLHEISAGFPAVVATGGGAILRPSNREALRRFGFVAWLSAEPSVLVERLQRDPEALAGRPPLTPSGTLEEITDVLAVRVPLYRAVADTVIATDDRTPAEVAEVLLAMFPQR